MKNIKRKSYALIISALCLCIATICAVIAFTHVSNTAAAEVETDGYNAVYRSSQAESNSTQTTVPVCLDYYEGKPKKLITCISGQPMPQITVESRDGYIFDGFYYDPDGENIQYYNADGTSARVCDLKMRDTLHAKWIKDEEEHFTIIHLQLYGGYCEEEDILAFYGQEMLPVSSMPIKKGYNFHGIYLLEDDGTETYYYDENMQGTQIWNIKDIEINLHVKWIPRKYNIELYNGDDVEQPDRDVVRVTFDEVVPEKDWLVAPTRIGYTFEGYYEFPNGRGKKYYDKDMHGVQKWDIDEEYILCAYWKGKEYDVYFNQLGGNGGIKAVSVIFGQPMPSTQDAAPTKLGYSFLGYYSLSEGGDPYYDSDLSSAMNWNIDEEDYVLYAHWELTEYTIEYDLSKWNGSEFENSNPSHYTIEDEITFSGIETNGVVVRWLPAGISRGTTGKITVKPVTVKTLAADDTSYTVSFCNSEIIMIPQAFSTSCKITVSSNVENLTIVGVDGIVYNMRIEIKSAVQNFILGLQNVSMQAPQGCNAITLDTDKNLILSTNGNVAIYGGKGTNFNVGNSAIYCGTLYIYDADNLVIQGGVGGLGRPASRGKTGGAAVYVANNKVYIYCSNVTVRGGNGGTGGCYNPDKVFFDEYGNTAIGVGVGGYGGQPFGGTAQVTVYQSESSTNVNYEEGGRGTSGSYDYTYDPTNPINPVDPIYPVDPPIITH